MGCDSSSAPGSGRSEVCSAREEIPESLPQSGDSEKDRCSCCRQSADLSLIARGAELLIRGYQCISRYTPAVCRFRPTCSEYTRQAIVKYGFWRGGLMGAYRILRCNPFNHSGVDDPVP